MSQKEENNESTMKTHRLFKEALKVDKHFVIMAVREGNTKPVLKMPNKISINQTQTKNPVNLPHKAHKTVYYLPKGTQWNPKCKQYTEKFSTHEQAPP